MAHEFTARRFINEIFCIIPQTIGRHKATQIDPSNPLWVQLVQFIERQNFLDLTQCIYNLSEEFSLQDIEWNLRANKLECYIIARSPVTLFDGFDVMYKGQIMPFVWFISMRPTEYALLELWQESSSYEENFEKLAHTGFSIVYNKKKFVKSCPAAEKEGHRVEFLETKENSDNSNG